VATTKYFHFPADDELREAVEAAAKQDRVSMSRWIQDVLRKALDDRNRVGPLLAEVSAKTDRILELLENEQR